MRRQRHARAEGGARRGRVEVTCKPGAAEVDFDPARTGPSALRAAIEGAGYDVAR